MDTVEAEERGYPLESCSEVEMLFGQGDVRISTLKTHIGEIEATLLDNVPTLISPVPIIEAGGSLHLEGSGGYIANANHSSACELTRTNGQWTCDLDCVERFVIRPPPEPDPILLTNFQDPFIIRRRAEVSTAVATARIYLERDIIDPWPAGQTHAALWQEGAQHRILAHRGDGVMLRFIELHERAGHLHYKAMQTAVSGPHPAWRNAGLTFGQIGRCGRKYSCPHCLLAKRKRDPIPTNEPDPDPFDPSLPLSSRNALPGEIISMDPQGPVTPMTSRGHKLWFLFKDVGSGYDHTVFASDQSMQSVKEAITFVFDWYVKHGKTVRILRSDHMKVALSDEFQAWIFEKYGTTCQHSIPYCHWQNAVERDVQTVVAGTSVALHAQQWLNASCWDLAMLYFLDCRNRTPNKRNKDGRSPLQLITGEVTDFESNLRFAFGDLLACATAGNTSAEGKSWKFDAKNELGIFIGTPSDSKRGVLVYWPQSQSISERFHCWKLDMSDTQFMQYYRRREEMRGGAMPLVEVLEHTIDFRILQEVAGRGASDSPLVRPAPDPEPAGSFTPPLLEVEAEDELAEEEARRRMLELPPALPLKDRPPLGSDRVLRPRVQRVVATAAVGGGDSEQLGGETIGDVLDALGLWHFENAQYAGAVKVTVGQAIKSAEAELWVTAMKAEIESLISGGTWVLTKRSDIVGAHRILHSTAQLKKKLFQDLSVDKYKCRLCVCGNELYGQVPETYSPTVGALAHAAVHQVAIIDRCCASLPLSTISFDCYAFVLGAP